jgi:spermidine synthase
VAAVLTVFMAGLGAGSYLAGRLSERLKSGRRLLSAYGLMEAAIGVYGLASPLIIGIMTPFYRMAYNHVFDIFWLYQVLGLLGCGIGLILPVALMGATLPVLCRFHVLTLAHLGERAGRLYGINTAGAAVGAVLAGFFLLPALGVWGTLAVGALLNVMAAAVSLFWLTRLVGAEEAAERKAAPLDQAPMNDGSLGQRRKAALAIFGISGFAAMVYEVVWTRLLGLLIGPTTYSFTVVVATFILGLAAGSVVFGRIADRGRHPLLILAATQMGAAVLAVLVSQFLGVSQFFFAKLIYALKDAFALLNALQAVLLFVVLLPPTFLLGGAFPLVNRIYARSFEDVGRTVGTAYGANTVGAIAGSLLAGFLLIPLMGKENALRTAASMQFFAGLAVLAAFSAGRKELRLVMAGCLVIGIFFFVNMPSWNRMLLSYGRYKDFRTIEGDILRSSWWDALWRGNKILMRHERGRELVFYGDGAGGFTSVERLTDNLGNGRLTLLNSGKPDASSHGDRSTQTLLAHLPLLFHPDPRTVMVLGLASAMTAGETLLYPIKRVDALEISEQVVKACRLFSAWNNNCLEDPRLKVIVQDGRNHLALTNETYDVIVSEPSNPWMAGLANLYSREFFENVKERLAGNGIFVQWIHSYEMDWPTFALVGRTFASVFPQSVLFATLTGVGDYLMVGFKQSLALDPVVAARRLSFAQKSRNMNLPDTRVLFHLIVSEDLKALFGEGPIHTDMRPILEFEAPRMLHKKGEEIDEMLREKSVLTERTREIINSGDRQRLALDMMRFSASVLSPLFMLFSQDRALPEERAEYLEILESYCRENQVGDYGVFPDRPSRARCARIQADLIERQTVLRPDDPELFFALGIALREAGKDPLEAFKRAASLDPFHVKARNSLGVEYLISGDLAKAEALFLEALKIHPGYATAYFNLAQVSLRRGERSDAVTFLRKGLAWEDNSEATELLRRLLLS